MALRRGGGPNPWRRPLHRTAIATALIGAAACARPEDVLTISGSAVGAEADVLRTQLDRFMSEHPGVTVEIRETPDAADQRHQQYVQWLNARAEEPDVLQLDVIWTPEFASAGWILPLDRYDPPADAFFAATVRADTWGGRLYALPWFVDVGMLYWRSDLFDTAPATYADLETSVRAVLETGAVPYGLVLEGARYEGLITTFVEVLAGFGGAILDDAGAVVVDRPAAVRALEWLRDAVSAGVVPEVALTMQEEQARFAFQNGESALMRNWPYAYPLLQDSTESAVAGRFRVAPMPAAPGGRPAAALGGAQLAINANTREPDAAYALIEYLTRPEQMLERARAAGQLPARPSLYEDGALDSAIAMPTADARRIIEAAVPRPVTPVYAQLSEILQVELHRALTGQVESAAALSAAAAKMRVLLERTGVAAAPAPAGG